MTRDKTLRSERKAASCRSSTMGSLVIAVALLLLGFTACGNGPAQNAGQSKEANASPPAQGVTPGDDGNPGTTPTRSYAVGDRIAVVRNEAVAELESGETDKLGLGRCFVVHEVKGSRLKISTQGPGWIDSLCVAPLEDGRFYTSMN